MAQNVEIIDFIQPFTNSKNIYISGILTNDLSDTNIMTQLHDLFSKFGLLYGVQVFAGRAATKTEEASYYAFVTFYSCYAAQTAKLALSGKLKIGSQICKVAFAQRAKITNVEQTYLPATKCKELANYYLGFNGWFSRIKLMEEDENVVQESSDLYHVRFFTILELQFPRQGLNTQGLGAWEEIYCPQDPASKATAILKAKKCSLERALQDAFSKVLLVVINNEKVTVEIDMTKRDMLTDLQVAMMAEEQVLKVNNLEEEPSESDAEEDNRLDGTEYLDDINLQILQELGEEFD